MFYLFESVFVGIYTIFIYLFCYFLFSIFSVFSINNIYFHNSIPFFSFSFSFFLFIVGFIKHFLAYYFSLHSLYCNWGEACKKEHKREKHSSTYISTNNTLLLESIIEGFIFVILGNIFIRLSHFLYQYQQKENKELKDNLLPTKLLINI